MSIQTTTQKGETAMVQDRRDGKYLTFFLGEEEYGLEILKVREIIGMMKVTAVPRMPEYMKGVINLRGKVIPVIDLRLKFHLPEAERTSETCIIVVDVHGNQMGTIVDRVSEVQDIHGEEIEDSPNVGAAVDTSFILGMGKSKGNVEILLDIDKIFTDAEFEQIITTTTETGSQTEDQIN